MEKSPSGSWPSNSHPSIPLTRVALLFFAQMCLLLASSYFLQSLSLLPSILITEIIIIALPVFLILAAHKINLRPALVWNNPGWLVLVGAALCGLSAWLFVSVIIEGTQEQFFPLPPEMIEELEAQFLDQNRPFILDALVMALLPAICEELLFRGLLLQSTLKAIKPMPASILNAVMFGLFHLNPYRFLPTTILGFILARLTLRTGSLWPAMVFHGLNNFSALAAGRYLEKFTDSGPSGKVTSGEGGKVTSVEGGKVTSVEGGRGASAESNELISQVSWKLILAVTVLALAAFIIGWRLSRRQKEIATSAQYSANTESSASSEVDEISKKLTEEPTEELTEEITEAPLDHLDQPK